MKKELELQIKISNNWYKEGLDSKLLKKFDPLIDEEVQDIKKHFSREDYELDLDYIVAAIMRPVFGNHIDSYIKHEILLRLGKGYAIGYSGNGLRSFVKKTKKKKGTKKK